MTSAEAHRLARDKGVSTPLYLLARVLLTPFFRVWLRLRACGSEHVPRDGAAIVAPNHKSIWDPFLVAACAGRPLRFMAKAELFEGRGARWLVRLGAFPVRRMRSDADAIETARAVLRDGQLLAVFPEGRVVRDAEALGMPKRGVGRLALETGAPLVPAALDGTDGLRAGPPLRPGRVRVAFAPPIPVHEMCSTPEAATEIVEGVLWPSVEHEFRRLVASRAHA